MKYKVSWLKKENHDEHWDNPLQWNRTSVKTSKNIKYKRDLEEEVAKKQENIGKQDVVIMQYESSN